VTVQPRAGNIARMKKKTLRFGKGFRVAFGNRRAQAAEMVIPPGDAEGDPGNTHRGADQWLYVVSGRGRALVNGRAHAIGPGSLLLIERGDRHEIRNTGRTLLKTLNVYVPPAYRSDGNELPAGKPSAKAAGPRRRR
jgi:mannose-6-phosphate isomerase-like protein (cupin superfamily)